MRRYLIVLLLLAMWVGLRAQTPSVAIKFDERVYNFGTILEKNGKVSHSFIFTNTGKAPVTIDDIHSACGCVGKIATQGTIKPGGKGKVTITFDPGYKSGFFSKEIVVLSNNREQYNRIWVEGNIQPMEHPIAEDYPYYFGHGIYLRLKVMAFGYLKPGETKEMELHYANSTGKEMRLELKANANIQGLQFKSPGKIKPGAKGVIRVSYTMPQTRNKEMLFHLYLYVDGNRLGETVDVRVLNEAGG